MTNQENQNLGRRITAVGVNADVTSTTSKLKDGGKFTTAKGDIDKALEQMGSVYRRPIIEADPGTRHSSLDDNGE